MAIIQGSETITISYQTAIQGVKLISISNQTAITQPSYGARFTTSYKRRSGGTTRIDFIKKGYTGTTTTLKPAADCLKINTTGDINNIFGVGTIGSGAVINIVTTPLTALELFDIDPQKFVVKVYSSTGTTNLIWQGFVNASIYTEDYSASYPVPIQIECNDGMALLDELYYNKTDPDTNLSSGMGVNYTGTALFGIILNNILNKLDIKFNNIYTNVNIANAYVNPFFDFTFNQDNYIDESLQVKSCREVLNSIFQGMNMVFRFLGEDIYIYNPINLNNSIINSSSNYNQIRMYSLPTFAAGMPKNRNIGGYLDVSGDTISWYQTGQKLDIQPQSTLFSVKYDPYNITGGLSQLTYDFNDKNNLKNPDNFGSIPPMYGTMLPFQHNIYFRNDLVQFKGWKQAHGKIYYGDNFNVTVPNMISHFGGYKSLETDDPEFVIKLWNSSILNPLGFYSIQNPAGGDLIIYDITGATSIFEDSNTNLKITLDGYMITIGNDATHTKDNDYHYWTTPNGRANVGNDGFDYLDTNSGLQKLTVNNYNIAFALKCGDYYWSGGVWGQPVNSVSGVDISKFSDHLIVQEPNVDVLQSSVGDKWVTSLPKKIPLKGLAGGKLTFILYDYWNDASVTPNSIDPTSPNLNNSNNIQNCALLSYRRLMVKNLKIDIVNNNGESISNDGVQINGFPVKETAYKINPVSFSTTTGTGTYGTSRGAIKDNNNQNLDGINNMNSTKFDSAQLIIQSFLSQYKQPRFIMTANINVKNTLLLTQMQLITDTAHLPEKAFYIANSVYDDGNENLQVTMLELTNQFDDINDLLWMR